VAVSLGAGGGIVAAYSRYRMKVTIQDRAKDSNYRADFMLVGQQGVSMFAVVIAMFSVSNHSSYFVTRSRVVDWVYRIKFNHYVDDWDANSSVELLLLTPMYLLWWGYKYVEITGNVNWLHNRSLSNRCIGSSAAWSSEAEVIATLDSLVDTKYLEGDNINRALQKATQALLICQGVLGSEDD